MNDMIRMYSWLAAVLMFVSSCGERTVMLHGGSYEEEMYVDSLAAFFSQYSAAGSNDSVILTAGPMMREAAAEGDTLKMLCACVFAAQSWLFADNADSVKYCIDVARTYIRNCSSPLLNVVYCNVYGCYSLRAGLDYTLALNYYLDGLRWAEISGNAGHQTVMLLNIANIFYMQRNAEGYMYAERALKLAMSPEVSDEYVRSAARINQSQMLFLLGKNDGARSSLDTAWAAVRKGGMYSLYSPVKVLYAQILEAEGNSVQAENLYEEAVGYSRYTDYGTMSQIFLEYGNFLMREGKYGRASEKYRRGLDISEQTRSMEFRLELLGRMADCCWRTGDSRGALDYYRRYSDWQDSITVRKQYEFNRAVLSLQEVEHEKEILQKELEQQTLRHKMNILIVCVVLTVLIGFLIFLLYYRKRAAYRKLVEQHRHYVQKLEQEKKLQSVASSPSKELFQKIEEVMYGEKYFTRKGVTLEAVAEKVNSNRTYCSKAINAFAGCSFYKWLDALRIEEATRRIVADDTVLFKQLAEDLGYSSVSAFSKAFVNEIGCTPSNYREACRKSPRREQDENVVFT